jgi:hypothetical protein
MSMGRGWERDRGEETKEGSKEEGRREKGRKTRE